MSSELDHPRLSSGGLAHERNVILVVPEHRGSTTSTRTPTPSRTSAVVLLQHLVSFDDLRDFLVPLSTQSRCNHCHRRLTLRLGEVAYAQTSAFDEGRRKVRPALPLQRRP
jgi:hypothetical protein